VETTVFKLKFLLPFVAGLAAGLAAFAGLSGKGHTSPPALGVIPTEREALLVLKWILENHKDARDLKFTRWFPPTPVEDNPITHEPSLAIRAILENHNDPDGFEDYLFYVKDDQVLGGVPPAATRENPILARLRRLPQPPTGSPRVNPGGPRDSLFDLPPLTPATTSE
jgi:hypothetical protein